MDMENEAILMEATKILRGEDGFPARMEKYIEDHFGKLLTNLSGKGEDLLLSALKDFGVFSYTCGTEDATHMFKKAVEIYDVEDV